MSVIGVRGFDVWYVMYSKINSEKNLCVVCVCVCVVKKEGGSGEGREKA